MDEFDRVRHMLAAANKSWRQADKAGDSAEARRIEDALITPLKSRLAGLVLAAESEHAARITEIGAEVEAALRGLEGRISSAFLDDLRKAAKKALLGPKDDEVSDFADLVKSWNLKHFRADELLTKGAAHHNADSPAFALNTDPPRELWPNIKATAQVVDRLRAALDKPVILSSGYRCEAYNTAIGGARHSVHMSFRAIDFVVRGATAPSDWAAALRDMRARGEFRGGIGTYATFVHVDTRGENADW